MTQSFPDVPNTETLKLSRQPLLDRDNTARTMNSGTTLPTITPANYAEMLGMNVFKTDELINKQFTEYEIGTDTPTWTPILNGPVSATDEAAVLFNGTAGGKIKDSAKVLPSGDIVGTTDTQTLENKTLQDLTAPIAIADGGTGQSIASDSFDALSPNTTKGDLIYSDGTNNSRIPVGADAQILSADSAETSGLKWIDQAGGGGGGLTLQIETADFTMEVDKMHYVNSTSAIEAKLPSSYSIGDRFAIITGLSDDVSVMTNETVAAQSLIAGNNLQSLPSSSSSIRCGAMAEKMIYVEFSAVSASEFAAYVNDMTASDSAGYSAGGRNSVNIAVGTYNIIVFSTDTNANLSTNLSPARYAVAGINSASAGYIGGGGSNSDKIDKLTFSTGTSASISAVLSLARGYASGTSGDLAGYFSGGFTSSYQSIVDKLIYSSDTCSANSSSLTLARFGTAGFESDIFGYTAGGYDGAFRTTIDKISFSTDTVSGVSSSLSQARNYTAGYASGLHGYTVGGDYSPGQATTRIDRMIFSTESNSANSSDLSVQRGRLGAYQSNLSGYSFGGQHSGVTYKNFSKMIFSTSTNSSISAVLTTETHYLCGINN